MIYLAVSNLSYSGRPPMIGFPADEGTFGTLELARAFLGVAGGTITWDDEQGKFHREVIPPGG